MAVTIQELIAKQEEIKGKKNQLYDLETSVGTITCKLPNGALVSEAADMTNSFEGNAHIVYNCVVEPDLRDGELQKAYGTLDPLEIVQAIFSFGEVNKISGKLLDLAGYKGKIAAKLHNAVKN